MDKMTSKYVEDLKLQLKTVTKIKLQHEKTTNKLRIRRQCLSEELDTVKSEVNLLNEQLEELNSCISKARSQAAMIEICNISEKCNVQDHIDILNSHKQEFDDLLQKERNRLQLNHMELKAGAEICKRQIEQEANEKAERDKKKLRALEEEFISTNQECIVLKKRNKAIMLQLRSKLLKTEEMRRDLMQKAKECKHN